jgi:putative endonuclease
VRRVWEHKQKTAPGFTRDYGIDRLVYYEIFENLEAAIRRESALKHWKRDWKIGLIEEKNPHWHDLYDDLPSG